MRRDNWNMTLLEGPLLFIRLFVLRRAGSFYIAQRRRADLTGGPVFWAALGFLPLALPVRSLLFMTQCKLWCAAKRTCVARVPSALAFNWEQRQIFEDRSRWAIRLGRSCRFLAAICCGFCVTFWVCDDPALLAPFLEDDITIFYVSLTY